MCPDNVKSIYLVSVLRGYFNYNSDRLINSDLIEIVGSLYFFESERRMAGVINKQFNCFGSLFISIFSERIELFIEFACGLEASGHCSIPSRNSLILLNSRILPDSMSFLASNMSF